MSAGDTVSSSSSSAASFSLLGGLHAEQEAAAALARSAVDLLPELNGADLAMSLSPKHQHQPHTTPFSVTDILSPIEESYRKLELGAAPPSPYRSSSGSGGSGTTLAAMSAHSPTTMNPYMQLGHQFPTQYCNGSELTSHYTDMRSSAGWYGSTANDPRFATISRNYPKNKSQSKLY
ncbi:UNVERIFIED_CONTAM: hypothetical protein PYX00_007697 [Menopon gallinae]|uniref:Uncharacterized protein n=1 Tax=Menopon gallinae TaxID=328185 RepID=A0AAW2HKA0_9NEOP